MAGHTDCSRTALRPRADALAPVICRSPYASPSRRELCRDIAIIPNRGEGQMRHFGFACNGVVARARALHERSRLRTLRAGLIGKTRIRNGRSTEIYERIDSGLAA